MPKRIAFVMLLVLSVFRLSAAGEDDRFKPLSKFSYGVNLGFRVSSGTVLEDNVPMIPIPSVSPGDSFTLETDLGCRWYFLFDGVLGLGANLFFSVPHDNRYDIGVELSLQARLQVADLTSINLGVGYVYQYLGNDPLASWTDSGVSIAVGIELFFKQNHNISLTLDYKVKYISYENSDKLYANNLLRFGIHFWI